MRNSHKEVVVDNMLQELTEGRPFVFVIMPFKAKWLIYEEINEIIENKIGLPCIRADDVNASGYDLLEKIHLLIERATLVVAEISLPNPNVFYEVGYASAERKNILLLAEKGSDIPADIKGKELIIYDTSKSGISEFRETFYQNVKMAISSRISLLREMLLGEQPTPSYIIASPKYPGEDSRIKGQVYDKKTFGDNLGVVGLLAAFGTILGERVQIELISAQYCEPEILKKDCNLYLIGSKKVNPISGKVLKLMTNVEETHYYLGRIPESEEVGDYIVRLYRITDRNTEVIEGKVERRGPDKGIIHTVDHGIIVRGPHPIHNNRIAVIMAGAHSLGTGGACIAATRSTLIQQIREALPQKSYFSDRDKTIWAAVKAEAGEDGLLDESGVKIIEAGVW